MIQGDILIPVDVLYGRATYASNLWFSGPDQFSGGRVPYEFHSSVSPSDQAFAIDVMAEWEATANVHFVPRNGDGDYIRFVNSSDGNFTTVGRLGGRQDVNIEQWSFRILAHELGHTLGLWHEHTRLDRNCCVTVNYDNIDPNLWDQFDFRPDRGPTGSREVGPYDFESIMHYSKCEFSVCGQSCPQACEAITPHDPQWRDVIGKLTISAWDARIMSFMYQHPTWRFLNVSAPPGGIGVGNFVAPWYTFTFAYQNTPPGYTVYVFEGEYTTSFLNGVLDKPIVFDAVAGPVTIRR